MSSTLSHMERAQSIEHSHYSIHFDGEEYLSRDAAKKYGKNKRPEFEVDIKESMITVQGNLYFNDTMKRNLFFNNDRHNKLYQRISGQTNNVQSDSDYETDASDDSFEEKYDKEKYEKESARITIHKGKSVTTKINLFDGIFLEHSDAETIEIPKAESLSSNLDFVYLTQYQMLRCVDFAFVVSDIGILVADISLLFLYDESAFDHGIFWSIFLFNLGCLVFNECDYEQKAFIKKRMNLFVCVFQHLIFMFFCSFSKISIILYLSIAALTLFAILCQQVERCNNSYRDNKVLDRAPHSLWAYIKNIVIGLQTLPFLYFSKDSDFHSFWFYICAVSFIWYPHILEWINCIKMNVANNMICRHLILELHKTWGQKISQIELKTFDNFDLTINQLPQNETMKRLNLAKLWIERIICVGFAALTTIMCAIYLWRSAKLQIIGDGFGFAWSIIYLGAVFCLLVYSLSVYIIQ